MYEYTPEKNAQEWVTTLQHYNIGLYMGGYEQCHSDHGDRNTLSPTIPAYDRPPRRGA